MAARCVIPSPIAFAHRPVRAHDNARLMCVCLRVFAAPELLLRPEQRSITEPQHEDTIRDLESILAAGATRGADIVHLPLLMANRTPPVSRYSVHAEGMVQDEASYCRSAKEEARRWRVHWMDPRLLYAQRGKDTTHPSPHGHLLIAAATARYVAKRILELVCRHAQYPEGRGAHQHRASVSSPARTAQDYQLSVPRTYTGESSSQHSMLRDTRGAEVHVANESSAARGMRHAELCYTRADALPLESPMNG